MDEDEELYREMNEEDDLYMGDRDDCDDCDDAPDDDYEEQSFRPSSSGGMGCLVMLPLIAGALTFVVVLIARI